MPDGVPGLAPLSQPAYGHVRESSPLAAMKLESAYGTMDAQTYTPWKPELWPGVGLDVHSLVDDESGLTIRLDVYQEDGTTILYEVIFRSPKAYRTIDEGFRLAQWGPEWEEFARSTPSAIYLVHDSAFLQELHELSMGVSEAFDLLHYFVVTDNLCIDVLADAEPSVRALGTSAD